MDKVKEFVRKNKALVAAIVLAVSGALGAALSPETADKLATVIVDACCKADETVPVK